MPVAAMHEDNLAAWRKDQVWAAGEVPALQPESVPHGVSQSANNQLRLGVASADAGHDGGSVLWRYVVHLF